MALLPQGEIKHLKAASPLDDAIQRLVDQAGVEQMPLEADVAMGGCDAPGHLPQLWSGGPSRCRNPALAWLRITVLATFTALQANARASASSTATSIARLTGFARLTRDSIRRLE